MNRRALSVDKLVGQRVRLLRLARHMSQSDLATALGISFQQVQKYENGTNRISASRLFQIAKTFEVEVAALFADATALDVSPPSEGQHNGAQARIDLEIVGKLSQLQDVQLKRNILDLLSAIGETSRSR